MPDAEIDLDEVYRSNFERAAFWDIQWIAKARSLYESARKLEPEVVGIWENLRAKHRGEEVSLIPDYYQGAYFMLIAFATENLLKAAAVARNSTRYKRDFRDNKKFPNELQEHDLVKLAKLVDLDFSVSEEDLLRRLKRSAIWYGRYPAPLKYPEMAGKEKYSNGNEYSVNFFGGDDIVRLNEFVLGLPSRLGLNEHYWKQG
jgi:hypothetical protein